MVGIVIVSHSHRLAEGAAELAREMAGPDVKLETAGGLDLPGTPIGTDAVMVMKAIERAWSDDGVLVLMDLGSAVLSAEMALDMLPEDRRSKIVLSEAPLVEGAVAAAVTAKLGAPMERVAAEARTGQAGKAAHLGKEAPAVGGLASSDGVEDPTMTIRLVVRNEHGLHARPAARFVQTASGFDADVRVANATAGRGPVTAGSLNAVATLGIVKGDEIEVLASGPRAGAVLEAIRALADRDFDEVAAERPTVVGFARVAAAAAADGSTVLRGLPTSPGAATGPARRFHTPVLEVTEQAAGDPEAELGALDLALAAARAGIGAQRALVAGRAGDYQAAIFDAHLLFLEDDLLIQPVRRSIREAGRTAARAWADAAEEMASAWDGLDDEYQRGRAVDLRSVGQQVLAHLLGIPAPRLTLEGPGILVAADLAPADTVGLDPSIALGIATAFGGPTSHAAVLARSLGIPAVVALGDALLSVAEGTELGLDADAGLVYVGPTASVVADLGERAWARREADLAARTRSRAPAMTVDGVTIEVAANVGSVVDAAAAVEAGCDGVGLFRTEFLFLQRDAMPTEEEQEAAYRGAAEVLDGRPMTIRTLDVGADKPLPYLPQPHEENPFLGVRGIRLGLERPELLSAQLRAILRVAVDHPVRVMFPMVATLEELRAARTAIDAARASLEASGVPVPASLEVGIMIEIPAAALTARALAPEVDFFSIGTNDLTQYAMAADRGNGRVAGLSDPLHPAVLRLIASTVEAAEASDRWVGVCGELAGDQLATPLLLGLGVRELSVGGAAIPIVKDAVRAVELGSARALAERALGLATAAGVRELLRSAADASDRR